MFDFIKIKYYQFKVIMLASQCELLRQKCEKFSKRRDYLIQKLQDLLDTYIKDNQ